MTSVMAGPHKVVQYIQVVERRGGKEFVREEIAEEVEFASFTEALANYRKLTFTPDGTVRAEIKVVPRW